jgi:hypothetical protein
MNVCGPPYGLQTDAWIVSAWGCDYILQKYFQITFKNRPNIDSVSSENVLLFNEMGKGCEFRMSLCEASRGIYMPREVIPALATEEGKPWKIRE